MVSNLSVTSPTSQLIHQPFRRFTYVTAHSPTLLSLLLRHRLCTYVIRRASYGNFSNPQSMSSAHSPNFPSLHLRHSSFSNPSVALPTSQFILQRLRCFTYVTSLSPTLISLLLRHRLFTYVTWRAAHGNSVIVGRIKSTTLLRWLFTTCA